MISSRHAKPPIWKTQGIAAIITFLSAIKGPLLVSGDASASLDGRSTAVKAYVPGNNLNSHGLWPKVLEQLPAPKMKPQDLHLDVNRKFELVMMGMPLYRFQVQAIPCMPATARKGTRNGVLVK